MFEHCRYGGGWNAVQTSGRNIPTFSSECVASTAAFATPGQESRVNCDAGFYHEYHLSRRSTGHPSQIDRLLFCFDICELLALNEVYCAGSDNSEGRGKGHKRESPGKAPLRSRAVSRGSSSTTPH